MADPKDKIVPVRTKVPKGAGTPAKKLKVTSATGKNKDRLDAANKNDGTKTKLWDGS